MLQFKILWNWFFIFSVGFVLSTIIGTQTHELGHIAVAQSLGYDTELYYGSMSHRQKGYNEDEDVIAWRTMFKENGAFENFNDAQKQHVEALYSRIREKFPQNPTYNFYIALGGPAQTIFTCFLGLFILAYRKINTEDNFKPLDWLAVFLSLFVLREVFNTVMAAASYFIKGSNRFGGDEFAISEYLGMNQWTIPIMTAILGAIIASFVIFMIVPKQYRFTFILAGFVGSISGFILWFNYLGPWLFS